MNRFISTMVHVPLIQEREDCLIIFIIQYIHVGFIALIASTAIQRIIIALPWHVDSASIFFVDASAILLAIGALALVFRGGRYNKYAYAPLILHYVGIYAALPDLPWNRNAPTDILVRFEFLREENRIQLWAFTLNGAPIARHLPPSVRQRGFYAEDFGEPCLSAIVPSPVGARNANSVQLLLNGASDKCLYFLQIKSDFFESPDILPANITSVLFAARNVAALITFLLICLSARCCWRTWRNRRCMKSAERDANGMRLPSVVMANDMCRLEDKLRQCNSIFSIETALVSGGASSTVLSSSSASSTTSAGCGDVCSGATTVTAHSGVNMYRQLPRCHFNDII